MKQLQKVFRSVLFAPCDRLKIMEKSINLQTDVVIFDLEDSVHPMKKNDARRELCSFIEAIDHKKNRPCIAVRINCCHTTPWGKDDASIISSLPIDAIVIPKVDSLDSLNQTMNNFKQNNNKPIWAMIESCKGVINCETIATSEHIEAIVLGGNDLTKDMKAKFSQDRKHLRYSMSKCVTAARSAGKSVIDAVYMDIKNVEGLKVDCELGREYGFDGKSLIHPDQIDICNNIFSPSQEELHYANKVIAAWNKAMEEGKSVAVLDGKLIEYLHVHEANAIIKTATIIENNKNL